MKNSQEEICLTNHLKERFLQRTNKRYKHLEKCKFDKKSCQTCKKFLREIKLEARKKRKEIEEEIKQALQNSEEERSYLNNYGFMKWYYEKYGYDKRFKFLIDPSINLLFIVVIEKGKKIVVTCVRANTHLVGKTVVGRNKFRKKKKQI